MNSLLVTLVCAIAVAQLVLASSLASRELAASSSSIASDKEAPAGSSSINNSPVIANYRAFSPAFLDVYINHPRYLQALFDAATLAQQQYAPVASNEMIANDAAATAAEQANTPVKRAQTFVRFGKRAQTFVRFG